MIIERKNGFIRRKSMKYHKTSIEMCCDEVKCVGTINGEGIADQSGEIVKFLWLECNSCDWNQYS